MYGSDIPRATAPGAAAGRTGDARAASARFLRVRGITGDANTSIFGVVGPRTHSTGCCRDLFAPAPAGRTTRGGQGGLPGQPGAGPQANVNPGKS